jgi:formiminotetrahydrofolate cyclodeaminase
MSLLTELSLRDFTSRLADRTPTPGGGSMAAYLVASGSALAAMSFRFTSGEKYAAFEAQMTARASELDRIRAHALDLVERDAQAYDAVTAAYKLPKATDAAKSARAETIQLALRGALAVPAETMLAALDALRATAAGAADLNPNLASDCASGAWCLWSACESAFYNVRINAASLADKAYAHERLAECAKIQTKARALCEDVRTAIEKKLS